MESIPRRLGVPRLETLVGSGVFYGAAASDTPAMEGRDVFVVGAGNSAGQTALHLARYARRVTMLVRGDSLARNQGSVPNSRTPPHSRPKDASPRRRSRGQRALGATAQWTVCLVRSLADCEC
jgi:thioredoxin reductase